MPIKLTDIEKTAIAEGILGLQAGARRGMERAEEIGFAQWQEEQRTERTKLRRTPRVGVGIDRTELNKRRKIMSLRDERNILANELKTMMGDRTRPEFEFEATRKYEKGEFGVQKLAIKNYRFLIDNEKRIKEIKEQIRKLNKGLPINQRIDIDEVLPEEGEVTVISPEGIEGTIPRDQLDEALKQGYRIVE